MDSHSFVGRANGNATWTISVKLKEGKKKGRSWRLLLQEYDMVCYLHMDEPDPNCKKCQDEWQEVKKYREHKEEMDKVLKK